MKGQIIIDCIQDDEVNAVAEAENWPAEGKVTGIQVNAALITTKFESVEIVYALCQALGFDDVQKVLLIARLTGMAPSGRGETVELKGPLHGQPADPDAAPPPLL